MALTHPRHALRIALSLHQELNALGVGVVVPRELEQTACRFALDLAARAGFRTVEIGMTSPLMRALRSRAAGFTNGFEYVHFRWVSRRRTARARQLATRASGIAAQRREHTEIRLREREELDGAGLYMF